MKNKKILYITSSFPYPPNSGGQMRSFYILKGLSARGDVTLLSPPDPDKSTENESALKEYCRELRIVNASDFGPHSKDGTAVSLGGRLRKVVEREPWILQDFISDGFRQSILDCDPQAYDLIVIRYPLLAYYFFKEPSLSGVLEKTVVDVDDILVLMEERRTRQMRFGYEKIRHLVEVQFLKNYYRNLRKVRSSLVTSVRDKQYLEQGGFAKNVYLLPNAIDVQTNGFKKRLNEALPEILFCGMLSFAHNEEAVVYFCEHVLPRIRKEIPEAVFTVIGKNPTAKIKALSGNPGVNIEGFVPSTQPYYERAAVTVVPILNGAGTRIKVLEAMAYRTPVVSTTVGAEGIDTTPGKNIFLADSSEAMAKQCIELIRNAELRDSVTARGLELVKSKYDLTAFGRYLDAAIDPVLGEVCRA